MYTTSQPARPSLAMMYRACTSLRIRATLARICILQTVHLQPALPATIRMALRSRSIPAQPAIPGVTDPTTIRSPLDTTDWDGDGNVTESMNDEIQHMNALLFTALQTYATEIAGTPIAYTPDENPYYFIDTNANGVVDPDEIARANQYASWTPKLLIAAYNYQYVVKDPGAFAHNGKYVVQGLYDTLKYMGVDVSKMTRP